MTKKKMNAFILLGIFLLFGCATVMNYMSADSNVSDQMQRFWNSTHDLDLLDEYNYSFDYGIETLHRNMSTGYNPTTSTFVKPAYAFAMIDKEGNVLFKSESGIWWSNDNAYNEDFNYVSLEEYMTSEIKADIMKFKRQSAHGNLLVEKAELNFDGEKYRPVTITMNDQRGNYRTFTLSDLEITETINVDHFSYLFYDLDEKSIDHKYYVKLQKDLDERIRNFEFNGNTGGSGFSGSGGMNFNSVYEDFAFFYFVEYNDFYENITSDMFVTLTVYMTVLFGIMTIVILSIASKLYDKSQNLNEAKRAFTSAAAHELKTPLAVIQNQCECVIDNVAPEKNGEYIKSIYDEALRMNGIVQTLLTFNRLSDASDIHKEKCNLSEIVKAEVKKYEAFAVQMQVTVTSEIEENIFVECNSELIAMAIDNYLSNAVKYAENEKNVKVVLRKEHKGFFFKVYNDCENVNLSSDVWELLTREDKARNSSDNSTGMGLPICRKIFNLHGYEHWFTQECNGLSFIFRSNG